MIMKPHRRRTLTLLIVGIVIVAAGLVAWLLIAQNINQDDTTPLPFTPLSVEGETISGTWQTGRDGTPLYAFDDTVDNVGLTVSQQKLPETPGVADIAEGYNATRQLDVDQTTVYIGVSANGPQSLVFAKNDLLVLILSQQTVPDTSWVTYIRSLQ